MKLTLKSLLAIALLAPAVGTIIADDSCCDTSCDNDCNDCCDNDCGAHCKTKFVPFSQGENRARDYMMVTDKQALIAAEDWNWYLAAAFEYNQNFSREKIGQYFFGLNNCNCIRVGADGATGVDIRNVDLGLSPTFDGTLCIKPQIKNFIFDPALYVGLDRWVEGLWLWLKVPVTHTSWDLDCCETNSATGGSAFVYNASSFPGGLTSMSSTASVVAVGATSIKDALAGSATWGDKKQGFACGKVICCDESKTGVADLPLHLGYHFINKERGYMGIFGRVVFPTGSEKTRGSIFDPRVGYDRWQLGAGIDARLRLYEKNEETSLNAYLDFYVTHIFKKAECRSFDYKQTTSDNCFSRYLLLKEFDSSTLAYTGNLFSFADKFCACVKTGFNWNINGLLFLELKHKDWVADLGYEVTARDCEAISCDCIKLCAPSDCGDCNDCDDDCCDDTTVTNKYGVKGATAVFNGDTTRNSTSSLSTIRKVAAADATQTFIDTTNLNNLFDINAGRVPRAIANKVFTNLGYTWADRDYPVFAGLGGEVVFGNDNKALRQWGIWAKLGVSYN